MMFRAYFSNSVKNQTFHVSPKKLELARVRFHEHLTTVITDPNLFKSGSMSRFGFSKTRPGEIARTAAQRAARVQTSDCHAFLFLSTQAKPTSFIQFQPPCCFGSDLRNWQQGFAAMEFPSRPKVSTFFQLQRL
jgi:hypothetical protein